MASCCGPNCAGFDDVFGQQRARADLDRYRRKGPDRTTRMLRELLVEAGVQEASLLDVGGGVGALQHDLVASGVRSVVHVDASSAYLAAAREEAARRGLTDRIVHVEGNFVEAAADVGEADIVTLDRVVCCYRDVDSLVTESARRARRLYGLVFPRRTLAGWLEVRLYNVMHRLRGHPFRGYLHAPARVEALARRQGLALRGRRRTWAWWVLVYERADERAA